MNQATHYDVIVVGGGPAGLTHACYLAQAGMSVAVFEQAEFPRHQIGESLLPFSWRVFDDIGFSEKIRTAGFVQKFGATFASERSKREVTFRFSNSVNPQFESIYHVPRERFDMMLREHAKEMGVIVHQPCAVRSVEKRPDCVVINGEYTCRLLVRAAGITNAAAFPDNYVPNSPDDNATGLYTYFNYTPRTGTVKDGDILVDLFYENDAQRTPSWAWAIPLSSTLMSVGFVLRTHHFARYRRDGKSLDDIGREIMGELPFIRGALDDDGRSPLEPYRMRFNFQRVARQIVFDRELFIGDAAGFIDPVFSSGVHIALNSARLSAAAAQTALAAPGGYDHSPLLAFQATYRRLFWTYYRFVKTFYEKNLVENFFLVASPSSDERSTQLAQEFTSILSGDVDSPNSIVRSLDTARLPINPEVRAVFAPTDADSGPALNLMQTALLQPGDSPSMTAGN